MLTRHVQIGERAGHNEAVSMLFEPAIAQLGPLAAVGLVAPHAGLVAMQQITQHRAVGNIGRRRHRRVDQLGSAVDAKCAFMLNYHWLPFFV